MRWEEVLILNQLEFGSDEVEFERFDIVKLVKGVIVTNVETAVSVLQEIVALPVKELDDH